MKVVYKAPGKIILSGEHSVVYAKPALVSAIDLNLICEVSDSSKDNNSNSENQTAVNFIDKVVVEYFREKNIKFFKRPYILKITSNIPRGRGMGSSAAFCVALAGALSHFYKKAPLSKEEINILAYKAEKYFHGMPSGVDVSASCVGGLIFYRKEFEFLKHISALHMKIPKIIQDRLVLIDTGKPQESTAEMVSLVGKNFNSNPQKIERVLFEIEKITKRMVVAIAKEDPNLFSECIFDNQKYLKKLGIVSSQTDNLLKKFIGAGVGKVTGAGGLQKSSGLILFFIKDELKFEKLCKEQKLKTIPFKQQFEGVVEVKD